MGDIRERAIMRPIIADRSRPANAIRMWVHMYVSPSPACHPAGTNSTSEPPRLVQNYTCVLFRQLAGAFSVVDTCLPTPFSLACTGVVYCRLSGHRVDIRARSEFYYRTALCLSRITPSPPCPLRHTPRPTCIYTYPSRYAKNMLHLAPWSDLNPFSTLVDFLHTIFPTAPMAVQITLKSGDKVKVNGKNQLSCRSVFSHP